MSLAACWNIPEKINSFQSDGFLDHRNLLLSIFHLGSAFSIVHISNQFHPRITSNHTCTCTPYAHMCTHSTDPTVNTWVQFSYCLKLNLNIQ